MQVRENGIAMAKDAAATMEEVCHAAKFERSVLNQWNQSHDVKNLFVVDGSSFVTGGSQNPTMTILALSLRASEYLADQMKSGAL